MKKTTHLRIVFWLKAILFGLFGVNLCRILWRTWKYGGSKSTHSVVYDNDGDIAPYEYDTDENEDEG